MIYNNRTRLQNKDNIVFCLPILHNQILSARKKGSSIEDPFCVSNTFN